MKKILGLLFAVVLCVSLSGCLTCMAGDIRADAGSIFVLTPGALIYGTDATVFMNNAINAKAHQDASVQSDMPNTFEDGIRSNFAHGNMTSIPPITPTATTASITNGTITAGATTTPTVGSTAATTTTTAGGTTTTPAK